MFCCFRWWNFYWIADCFYRIVLLFCNRFLRLFRGLVFCSEDVRYLQMWFRIFLFPAQREVDVDSVDVGEEKIVFDFHRFFRWARRGAWFTLETQHGVTSDFSFLVVSSGFLELNFTFFLSEKSLSGTHTHTHWRTQKHTPCTHRDKVLICMDYWFLRILFENLLMSI